MKKQAEMCAKFEPKVGQPIEKGARFTYTDNFNYELMDNGVPLKVVYSAFGDITDPNHKMMDMRACAKVDCMNPCYGQNQYVLATSALGTCLRTKVQDTQFATSALS